MTGPNVAPNSGQPTPYRIFLYDRDANPVRIEHNGQSGAAYDYLYWDGAGKMRRMTYGGSDYQATYDGGGDRVTSLLGGVTTTYHMGAGLLQSTTSAGGSTVYTPGISQRKNGVDSYFHDDWIGSTRYLTDSTGNGVPTAYRFDAYGIQSSGSAPGATTVRFAGGHGYEDDGPNGTMLLGARYYAPGLGRFLSPDPIGHAGGLNLYGYASNDPVNQVDPFGLWEIMIGGAENPALVFTDANVSEGLATGTAAVGSSFSFGAWDGGEYRHKPGFGESRFLAEIGKESLITAGTLGAANAYHGCRTVRVLGRIARSGQRKLGSVGRPATLGTRKHHYAKRVLERANRRGLLKDLKLKGEVSYKNQELASYGEKGSVRFDVLQEGSLWRRPKAYDYVFGSTPKSVARLERLRRQGPKGLRYIKVIHP